MIQKIVYINQSESSFDKGENKKTWRNSLRAGNGGYSLGHRCHCISLLLALIFVVMFIDILTNAAKKLGVPYRTHAIINLELLQVPLLKEVSKEKQH